MIALPTALDVPLRMDDDGAIRVGNTRVLLEVVVAHKNGDTPEAIVSGFPTLELADVYAVISYYLSHRDAVDEYIRQVDAEGEEIRRKFEALNPPAPTREMLLARLAEKQRKQE